MPNTELLKVTSEYSPAGDQPQAIEEIVKSINGNEMEQVLPVSYTHLTLPTMVQV